jgi:hypothetical protein
VNNLDDDDISHKFSFDIFHDGNKNKTKLIMRKMSFKWII